MSPKAWKNVDVMWTQPDRRRSGGFHAGPRLSAGRVGVHGCRRAIARRPRRALNGDQTCRNVNSLRKSWSRPRRNAAWTTRSMTRRSGALP